MLGSTIHAPMQKSSLSEYLNQNSRNSREIIKAEGAPAEELCIAINSELRRRKLNIGQG